MRLADLLAEASTEDLERIAHEHARLEEISSRSSLLCAIESVIRSFRFVQEFIFNRQPPTFAMITLLLDEPTLSLSTAGFREAVLAETERTCQAIERGEILRRDDQLRVYRRVLYQARGNDLQIDPSEWGILGVLRQELEVTQAEHFLIEHHPDLREFWQQDGAFVRELHALRSAGIVFVRDGYTLIADDIAPIIRQVLGLEMSRTSAKRLFGELSGAELHDALARISAPTSGSKEERIERLLAHMVQPRSVLKHLPLDVLRKVCREIGAPVSGSKDEIVARIGSHVGADRDLTSESLPSPPTVDEVRRLDEAQFGAMFSLLRGHQLAGILGELDLRRWGTKEFQIHTLWESHRAETTLLSCLSNPDLESILTRLGLRPHGTKSDRMARLLTHFSAAEQNARRDGDLEATAGILDPGENCSPCKECQPPPEH